MNDINSGLIRALLFCGSLTSAAEAIEVPLVKEGGVYTIPVRINDVLTLDFIIDSGASEVQVPADVALTLLRTRTISQDDFLPGQTYRLADGSTAKSSRFVIKELKIGSYTVNHVEAGISPVEGQLLLGQSFLSKVPSWSQDNKRGLLIIGEDRSTRQSSASAESPPTEKNSYSKQTPTGWVANWGNDIFALAIDAECEVGEFLDKGLNKIIVATIPISRLKNMAESWGIFEDRAITVKGCWTSQDGINARSMLRRKKDGETWSQDLNFDDGSWRQIK
jgi:hypothetical protein